MACNWRLNTLLIVARYLYVVEKSLAHILRSLGLQSALLSVPVSIEMEQNTVLVQWRPTSDGFCGINFAYWIFELVKRKALDQSSEQRISILNSLSISMMQIWSKRSLQQPLLVAGLT